MSVQLPDGTVSDPIDGSGHVSVAVIIPTHNPRHDYLEQTLAGLQAQTLPRTEWELLIVDNRSAPPIDTAIVVWHPYSRVVREEMLGLTAARLRGLHEAIAPILVWVDDDNILAADYLETVVRLFAQHPGLGAAGGKSFPHYEVPPPSWYRPDLAPLGCRDLGSTEQWASWRDGDPRTYPAAAPIGAGLAIRREAMQAWANAIRTDPRRKQLGRTGAALTSGEDNDINLTLLAAGWQLAYYPSLRLQHLIPKRRLTLEYQQQIARATFRDFTRVLILHDISPWPPIPAWTVPLRQLKAWFTCQAWSGPAARIRWAGICGQVEGRKSWSQNQAEKP